MIGTLIFTFNLISHFPHCDEENFLRAAESQLKIAATNIQLNGRLKFVGGPTKETYLSLKNTYLNEAGRSDRALIFLKQAMESQAYDLNGTIMPRHPMVKFERAFPTSMSDPNILDNELCDLKYEFSQLASVANDAEKTIRFQYVYKIQAQDNNNPVIYEKNGNLVVEIKPTGWGAAASLTDLP